MKPCLPKDTRIYAIGDIHGCSDLLETLLDQIIADDLLRDKVRVKKLIFLGDYIDRGPDSARVIDILLHDLPKGFEPVFIKGNHEIMLLEAFDGEQAARFWLNNGGRETIASYGVRTLSQNSDRSNEDLMLDFENRFAADHQKFFNSLTLSHECGDYFFVHAGIHPDRPLDQQKDRDMMWIRDLFLFSEKDFGKIIVHGHTPVRTVDAMKNRIGIDTAAVYGGKLTALVLEGSHQNFLYAEVKKQKSD